MKRWAKNLNRYFKKNMCMVNKHLERCLTSLVSGKCKIKHSNILILPVTMATKTEKQNKEIDNNKS